MKRVTLFTILLAVLLASTAAADPGDTLWTRTYGGSGNDYGYSVQQTTDGGYIVAGVTKSFGAGENDVYLVKTDAEGDTLWTRTYGGSDDDYCWSVQQTTDGGYVIAGFTYSFGAGSCDAHLIKTDTNGDTLWTHTYGGSESDYSQSVQQTTDGGYIIAGFTSSFGAGSNDYYLVKTDANGDTLWTRTYGGSGRDDGYSVQQTTDGGYIIVGWTQSFGAGMNDVYLVKTDADGNSLWTRTYGGSANDCGWFVQQTSDGGYIIAGETASSGAGSSDYYLVKTDANGDILWTRTYGGSSYDASWGIQQTTDGGYVVIGFTYSFGVGGDIYLVKTDANGDSLWSRTYGGSSGDDAFSVQQTTDGGYIIGGSTRSFGAGGGDVWLVKVAGEAPLPDVTIEILPDDPPVTVPQGGNFGFTGSVTNNTEDPQVTDAWTMAVGPEKETYGPFKVLNNVDLEPFETRTAHFNQGVPNLAPLGFYNYIAYCGDYPSTVIDSSFFEVEVIEGQFTEAGEAGWVLTGSFSEGDLVDLPSEFALLSNYPNPFNAQTVIEYQLPVSSTVKLEVYNLLGSKVATLVNGEEEAAYKSVTWDASEVSSGVYFYKLTAGDYTQTRRMMLVR